jgi:hypothetical protein
VLSTRMTVGLGTPDTTLHPPARSGGIWTAIARKIPAQYSEVLSFQTREKSSVLNAAATRNAPGAPPRYHIANQNPDCFMAQISPFTTLYLEWSIHGPAQNRP